MKYKYKYYRGHYIVYEKETGLIMAHVDDPVEAMEEIKMLEKEGK